MKYWKLGCRWGKKTEGKPLFFDLLIKENIVISWDHLDFGKDAIILLTDGFTPLGIAKTLSQKRPIKELIDKESDFKEKQIYFEEGLMYYKAAIIPIQNPTFSYDAQQGIINIHNYEVIKNIQNFMTNFTKNIQLQSISKILEYKKQIILQGPPGTGKTREAKLIADSILGLNEIVEIDVFREVLNFTNKIPATKNNNSFFIDSFSNDIINFKESSSYEKFSYSISDLYECYVSNDFLKEDFVKYSQYSKRCSVIYILEKYKNEIIREQFKLIQFHPSYTYDDFVRGIVSRPNENGDGVLFTSENKILGQFSEKALKNLNDSKKGITELSLEKWLNEQFEKFILSVSEKIEKDEKLELTESVFIVELDYDAFRYKGLKGWNKKGNRMLFKDIKQAYLDENLERQDIKHNQNLSGLAKWHASYYIRVLDMFKTFLKDKGLIFKVNSFKTEKIKNYVLIIDEINRANLSSVLGELIYALEYRGEAVESMYNVDGYELILPPNLYIIGTMNTADRSVGHIDYAIRRRFAFVDVLPKDLSEDETIVFDSGLFKSINVLFTTDNYITRSSYLSTDFEPKDVALGHSYFIDKTNEGGSMLTRWQYEIKPILLEYIKDGILKEPARAKITEIDESFLNA